MVTKTEEQMHVRYLYLVILVSLKLPTYLQNLWVSARVMLTDNISVSNRLINGSIGTVKYLDTRSKPLCSKIYMKFDDPKVGNSLKDRTCCGELKECVPITARAKKFPLKK